MPFLIFIKVGNYQSFYEQCVSKALFMSKWQKLELMTALKKIFFEFSVAYLKNHSTYLKTITAKTNEYFFLFSLTLIW